MGNSTSTSLSTSARTKAGSVTKTQKQATIALECVNMSLRTGSPSTMLIARDTVVNDGDYNLLSILADIVRRSSKTSDDGDDDPRIHLESALRRPHEFWTHTLRCLTCLHLTPHQRSCLQEWNFWVLSRSV